MINNDKIKSFRDEIENLGHDVYNYKKVKAFCTIKAITEKAIIIGIKKVGGSLFELEIILPKSQVRKDNNYDLYISNWLISKWVSKDDIQTKKVLFGE